MRHLVVVPLVFAAACSSGHLEGRLVDARTGQPLANVALIAQADDKGVSMTCQGFPATTDADGKFAIEGICLSQTAYTFKASDELVWFPDGAGVAKDASGAVELKAWRSPVSSGLYLLSGDKFEALSTDSDIQTVTLLDSDQTAIFPAKVPDTVTLVKSGDFLVFVGKGAVSAYQVGPVLPSEGARQFGKKDAPFQMNPWVYVGVKFTTDTEYERVPAAFDAAKITSKEAGERAAQFVAADALAPGRYALWKEGDRRLFLVDFGATQPPPPKAPPAPAPAP